MIKVMWFLKRADHLTLAEFRRWWLERHAPDIARDQAPYLLRYVVRVRSELEESLPAGQPREACPWDGMAEQWFESIDTYNAVYARPDRPTRADTLAHTSRFERLVFDEHEIPVDGPKRR
jgi:EthD domain